MNDFVLLTQQSHQGLGIKQNGFEYFGCQTDHVMLMSEEIYLMQKTHPVFFRKNPETGQFYLSAMLGFEAGENLFVKARQWKQCYHPAVLARGPFVIGFQDAVSDQDREAKIYINLNDPRVSSSAGIGEQRLFTDEGKPTSYLQTISQILGTIQQGSLQLEVLIGLLTKYELIEPVALNIDLESGQQIKLTGNYTIKASKLADLSASELFELQKLDVLRLAYFIEASIANMKTLIELKNCTPVTTTEKV